MNYFLFTNLRVSSADLSLNSVYNRLLKYSLAKFSSGGVGVPGSIVSYTLDISVNRSIDVTQLHQSPQHFMCTSIEPSAVVGTNLCIYSISAEHLKTGFTCTASNNSDM